MLICLWWSVNVVHSLYLVSYGAATVNEKWKFLEADCNVYISCFFSSSMTVNLISLGCGQTKTFGDVMLDFGKH